MRRRGVTLVLVTGVLAILAALGAGFYTLMLSESRTASNYQVQVQAELLAEAGMADAIARVRADAYQQTENPNSPWFTVDYLHGAAKRISYPALDPKTRQPLSYSRAIGNSSGDDNSDQYTLEVTDASSKINVNACDNLGVLLDNLCRVVGPPLVAADPDYLQPRVWATLGAPAQFYDKNKDDQLNQGGCYYMPTLATDRWRIDINQKPKFSAQSVNGTEALYSEYSATPLRATGPSMVVSNFFPM